MTVRPARVAADVYPPNAVAPSPDGKGVGEESSLGIVVPVFNEAAILERALEWLRRVAPTFPVVVVDGSSSDGSVEIARRFFSVVTHAGPNRGTQLNCGTEALSTAILLFLHADSQLPASFERHIEQALRDPRVVGGCFRLRFDAAHPLLRLYSWFTRFPGRFFHFGDQGFFVRSEVFRKMGGFHNLPFLEDVDFLRRLRRHGRFVILSVPVTTSARRFLRHGIVRQMLRNILLVTLFELGVPARWLVRFYPHTR